MSECNNILDNNINKKDTIDFILPFNTPSIKPLLQRETTSDYVLPEISSLYSNMRFIPPRPVLKRSGHITEQEIIDIQEKMLIFKNEKLHQKNFQNNISIELLEKFKKFSKV